MVRKTLVVGGPQKAAGAATPSGSRRRTTYVDPGGRKGIAIDWSMGVIGVVLLLFAASLIYLLPEVINKPPEPLPQYKMTAVVHQADEEPSREQHLYEQDAPYRFEFEVPHNNVVRVAFDIFFEDDLAASLPDQFRIALYGPDNLRVGEQQLVSNGPPRAAETTTPSYLPGSFSFSYGFNVHQAPRTQFIKALHADESPTSVQERMATEHEAQNSGIWAVEVFLPDAGDCPDADDLAFGQSADCFSKEPNGTDDGNPIVITGFTYQYYTIEVAGNEATDSRDGGA